MFSNKANCVIGITTRYNEYLNISVPGLAQLSNNFVLVIYNDNPDTELNKKQIRKLGYDGPLFIINNKHNVGTRQARLNIIKFITDKKLNAQWGIFLDDDDMLVNLTIPCVDDDNWAIIQNMAVIKTRLIDVIGFANNPQYDLTPDGKNVLMVRPHLGLAGTLIRMPVLKRMAALFDSIAEKISDIDESVNWRPPVDEMMWNAVNIIAKHDNKDALPIFMDTINYVKTALDTADEKYGQPIRPAKNSLAQIDRILEKYNAAIIAELNTDAAPAGQNITQ
ncbi:MAG: hypothetical protein IKW57_04800 [Alphaproteobacteria bacterium]|nr:hypothetical protein [Alphaproteobacteria bacterium]